MIHLSAFADEISPDPSEQVACLRTHGIANIEFRSIFGINVLDLSREQHVTFRSLLAVCEIGLSAIGSPIGKIPITDPFEPHLDRFRKALELAAFYQSPRIRVFSYYIPEGNNPGDHRDEVVRRMSAKAELAAKHGVTLFLENEKGIYGDTFERVADVMESVASPALRHAFDPANYLEVGEDVLAAWDRLRPYVAHFHVKDYDPNTRKNVPTGEGAGRIAELIADAVAHGFAGFCVLEPHLVVAEKSYGFTGPDRFADAANALKSALTARNIVYS